MSNPPYHIEMPGFVQVVTGVAFYYLFSRSFKRPAFDDDDELLAVTAMEIVLAIALYRGYATVFRLRWDVQALLLLLLPLSCIMLTWGWYNIHVGRKRSVCWP